MNAPTKIPTRDMLRAAIVERDAAAGRERECAGALDRADRMASGAKIRLHQLGDVDAAILAHATAQYRVFAQRGGEPPAADVPPHLAEKRAARDAARAEHDAAKAAQSQLAGEHAAAQTERQRCDRAVIAAADAVVAEMALPALGAYVAAIREARQAWSDAEAIVRLVVPAPPSWAKEMHMPVVGLPDSVRSMLDRGFGTEPGPSEPPGRAAAWASLRERLRTDPDAELQT
jgi:hypothetical protein